MRYVMAVAIVAVLAAGAAFGLPPGEAEAGWEIGFVRYRIKPSVVDAWPTTDADYKATAKALRYQNNAVCEEGLVDSNGDGNLIQIGLNNCEGADGRHVFYVGGSRDNHPGTRGFTHPSGHSSAASGGNPRFTDAGIGACRIAMVRGSGCTFAELVTYHTDNSLGGY